MRHAFVFVALAGASLFVACGLELVGTAPSTSPVLPSEAGASSANPSADGPSGADLDGGPLGDGALAPDADAGICGTHPGAPMVDVGGSCIDSREVSEADYAAFLATTPNLPTDGLCNWKANYVPASGGVCRWDPAQFPNLPVVCVDWCDAFAYCSWAGKRLCGAIGGGSVAWSGGSDTNPLVDQWYRACSNAGTQRYPYGNSFDKQACNGGDRTPALERAADAGSFPGCVGGYPGLVDMVGNAFEWEDSCLGTLGAIDYCKMRGGSWNHTDGDYDSCVGIGIGNTRQQAFDDVGFRCCSR